MIAKEIKAWCAGIIDGEGWIGSIRNGHGTKRCLRVQVWNTNELICAFLKKYYGGILHLRIRRDRPNSQPIWHWQIAGKQCRVFLIDIKPYLVGKKEKCKETLKLI